MVHLLTKVQLVNNLGATDIEQVNLESPAQLFKTSCWYLTSPISFLISGNATGKETTRNSID
jgi:hypothetical protein